MELIELIRNLYKQYKLEFMIAVFIFMYFYFNHKNPQHYEKLVLKKQYLRDRHQEK